MMKTSVFTEIAITPPLKERTEYLESKGYKVLLFWNNDVMNDIESVIRAIIQAVEAEQHPQ